MKCCVPVFFCFVVGSERELYFDSLFSMFFQQKLYIHDDCIHRFMGRGASFSRFPYQEHPLCHHSEVHFLDRILCDGGGGQCFLGIFIFCLSRFFNFPSCFFPLSTQFTKDTMLSPSSSLRSLSKTATSKSTHF